MITSHELAPSLDQLIDSRVRILTESAIKYSGFVTAPTNVTLGEPFILPYVVYELRYAGISVSALTAKGGSIDLYARARVGGLDLIASGLEKPVDPKEFEQLFNVANYHIGLMRSS